MKKMLKNKKGFTLAELLIVIAILAILVAIAVPVFTAQLSKAKAATDAANLRSAFSIATNELLLNKYDNKEAAETAINAAVKAALGDVEPQSGKEKLEIKLQEVTTTTGTITGYEINKVDSKLAGKNLAALQKAAGQTDTAASPSVSP